MTGSRKATDGLIWTPEKQREMWRHPGAERWCEYLNRLTSGQGRVWQMSPDGNEVLGKCVLNRAHVDKNPSMHVMPDKGFVWCWPCKLGEHDPLTFLERVAPGHDRGQLFLDFTTYFNLSYKAEFYERLREEARFSSFKLALRDACNRVLYQASQTIAALNPDDESLSIREELNADEYEYARDAIAYLQSRGVRFDQLAETKIGVVPTRAHLYREFGSERDAYIGMVDRYYSTDFSQLPDAVGPRGGWIVFPYHVSHSQVGRFKVRHPTRPKGSDRDQWLGTGFERTVARGFFGLHQFSPPDPHAFQTVALVEGEFDQLAFAQEQASRLREDLHIVAGAGGGVQGVSRLSQLGYSHLLIIGDNDSGGNAFSRIVLGDLTAEAFDSVGLFPWPEGTEGMDPDELVTGDPLGFDQMRNLGLMVDAHITPVQWAEAQVEADIAARAAVSVKQRVEIVQQVVHLLKAAVDRDEFIDKMATRLGIHRRLLEKHTADLTTPEGFVAKIAQHLEKHMVPLLGGSESLKVFVPERKALVTLNLRTERTARLSMQSEVLSQPVHDWVAENITIPSWITTKMGAKGQVSEVSDGQIRADVGRYFDLALQSLHADAAPETGTHIMGQGIHLVDEGDVKKGYVVNGATVFRCSHIVEGQPTLNWEEMDVPRDTAGVETRLLEPDHTLQWSDYLLTAEDLCVPETKTPREAFDEIFGILNTYWRFVHQEESAMYLAATIMAAPVMATFPTMCFTYLTAPSQSGKSTLLLGLMSKKKYPNITLVEPSLGYDNWTAAGVLQKAGTSSLVTCLDECEDPDYGAHEATHKKEVEKILYYCRNMEAGMKTTRGTRHGVAREISQKFPLFAAGIHPFQKDVDVNRWITIELDNVSHGFAAPDARIEADIGLQAILDLRRAVTKLPLQHLGVLQSIYNRLATEIMSGQASWLSYGQARGARMILPVLAIMEWADVPDYKKWAQTFLGQREASLEVTSFSPEEALFRAVFHTNGVHMDGPVRHPISVVQTLGNVYFRNQLNQANVGVYWPAGSDVLLLWPEKLPQLLKYNALYRNISNTNQLYGLLSRHRHIGPAGEWLSANPEVRADLARYGMLRTRDLLLVKIGEIEQLETLVSTLKPSPNEVVDDFDMGM